MCWVFCPGCVLVRSVLLLGVLHGVLSVGGEAAKAPVCGEEAFVGSLRVLEVLVVVDLPFLVFVVRLVFMHVLLVVVFLGLALVVGVLPCQVRNL